jgi:hypothetical protein
MGVAPHDPSHYIGHSSIETHGFLSTHFKTPANGIILESGTCDLRSPGLFITNHLRFVGC